MPTHEPWRKGTKIFNSRTGSKNLGFMQVRKETLRVAPLEVGQGDLRPGGPGVPMMLDSFFFFSLQEQEETFLIDKFVLISAFSSLSFELFLTLLKL